MLVSAAEAAAAGPSPPWLADSDLLLGFWGLAQCWLLIAGGDSESRLPSDSTTAFAKKAGRSESTCLRERSRIARRKNHFL